MNTGKYYIGSTKDIENRFNEHKHGECKTTCKYLPIKLLFYREYPTINEALHMERKLKKI